jgi:GrpB-like predicted nucleotidyltransferase (UPF0157 family)
MVIELVEPDPTWGQQFEEAGRSLRSAFGARALRIDHIGSTAVPGLLAKDIIDVQVTVEAFEGVDEVSGACGYVVLPWILSDHRPPGSDVSDEELAKRFFEAAVPRRINLHIRILGRFNQRYPLLCRDYLRSHPSAARAYGEVKRHLAGIVGDDVDAYYAVKNPVFDIIMAAAEAWAAGSGWEPGPSDA